MPLIPGRHHHHNSPQLSVASVMDKVSPSLRPTLSNSSKSPKSTATSNNNSNSKNKNTPKSSPSVFGSDADHSSPSLTALAAPLPPASLDIRIESPPLVLYGSPKESTGTLLSGIFDVIINQDAPFPMTSVDLTIVQLIKQKKANPYKCAQCKEHATELAKWNVLSHAADLPKGKHGYPFSHLIPGSLPATCDNNAFSISYYLEAVAVPRIVNGARSVKPITLNLPLTVSRSVIKGPDKNSIRVFPPTALTATLALPSVAYPLSQYGFEMALEGVNATTKGKISKWKLRKINWKLDETIRMNWGLCPVHAIPREEEAPPEAPPPPPGDGNVVSPQGAATNGSSDSPPTTSEAALVESLNTSHLQPSASASAKEKEKEKDKAKENKDTVYEELHTIRSGDFKNGWKSDFADKGKIEFSTQDIHIPHNICTRIEDPILGLNVSHVLIIELIIAEESVSTRSSRQAMPTGAARVLRMQFNLVVTSRSGLGIAWDDEVPPVYGDVPLSPPEYDHVAELPKFEELTPSVGAIQGINSTVSLKDYDSESDLSV